MARMAQLLVHAAANDVRVIGMPLGGNRQSEWQIFEQEAANYPHILFVASAGNNARNIDQTPLYPASLSLTNLLVVTSSNDFALPDMALTGEEPLWTIWSLRSDNRLYASMAVRVLPLAAVTPFHV